MNIITALNKRYIPYTTVMLTSLAMNNPEKIDVYLLNSELSDEDIACMQNALKNYAVMLHGLKVERELFSERLPHDEQWSIETYYRLAMLDILPECVERILYLDGDMVINKPLQEIYSLDFEGKNILACDDKCGHNTPDSYGPKNNQMLKEAYENGYRYFNAGVMLLNIKQMRKQYSFQVYLDAIESWNYEMEAPDQDILNWVHWKEVEYLDYSKYDLFARVAHSADVTYEEVKNNVAIIHFAGDKPWANGSYHFDIEKIWWDYAKETPYYRVLLEEFVDSAMNDPSIETMIRDLVSKNETQKKALDLVMGKIKGMIT